jgi:hypothetical protein
MRTRMRLFPLPLLSVFTAGIDPVADAMQNGSYGAAMSVRMWGTKDKKGPRAVRLDELLAPPTAPDKGLIHVAVDSHDLAVKRTSTGSTEAALNT